MKNLLANTFLWIVLSIAAVLLSIRADYGLPSWLWFQRSGSLVAVVGAILSYRSIARLGVSGVGGADTTIMMGKIEAIDDSGPRQTVKSPLGD